MKTIITRNPNQIVVRVRIDKYNEVVGSINKTWPFKGKFHAPTFEWGEGHEASVSKANDMAVALKECYSATMLEWLNLPENERVKRG